jgi:hypothetical protein
MTYRMLPGPGAGAFAPSRRKHPSAPSRASTQSDGARLRVWESEGGSLAKDSAAR